MKKAKCIHIAKDAVMVIEIIDILRRLLASMLLLVDPSRPNRHSLQSAPNLAAHEATQEH